jgi:hypothetical protein
MTTTLHIENEVRDYASWKEVFDKFGPFRDDGGVRRYRIGRDVQHPNRVVIDLDFDSTEAAAGFRDKLEKVWASPQSQDELVSHAVAAIHEVVEDTRVRRG